MKKLLLLLAAVLLLTAATVPSFADGNPYPHGSSCPITAALKLLPGARSPNCNFAAGEL
jgi:hypothetical protein